MTTLIRALADARWPMLLLAAMPLLAAWLLRPLSMVELAAAVSASLLAIGWLALSATRRLNSVSVREQGNLGQIAHGLEELRSLLAEQSANLGAVATGVADLRRAVETERGNLGAVAAAVAEVDQRLAVEQTNLGQVAAATAELRGAVAAHDARLSLAGETVEALKNASVGLELTNARYAALSDALFEMAARVDRLSGSPSSTSAAEVAADALDA